MEFRKTDLLSMGQVLVDTVADSKFTHRQSKVDKAFDDNEVHGE